ncbi:MAG: bifunctional ornithine acetyltransferase/N-acetylglutamate synthase, partial [Clostridiales Family XIII bacterium]|nr:bifunctional ornithine acetyltransferase/N-acetylglutamate synthase [Clostridiales Family XIII bacterium]
YFSSKGGEIQVCEDSVLRYFDEKIAKKILSEKEIEIIVDMNSGDEVAYAYGCDLTYDYVRINASYRT